MSMSDKNRMFVAQSNDNEYLYQDQSGNLGRILFRYYTQKDAQSAIERAGRTNQCHVVELVEAPAKVVLTKEQAEIVEEARVSDIPAAYISVNTDCDGEESLLMNAYVNGYTVAKDKQYLVELDGLVTTDGAKQYLTKKNGKWFACRRMPGMHQDFTDEELNAAPEWAQQLNREEVTDDE